MTKRSSPVGLGRWRREPEVLCLLNQYLACLAPVHLYFKSFFTYAFTVVCETPKCQAICRIEAVGEFHQWLPGHFRWTPWSGSSWRCPSAPPLPKARPMCWAVHFEGAGNGPIECFVGISYFPEHYILGTRNELQDFAL